MSSYHDYVPHFYTMHFKDEMSLENLKEL